MLGPGNAPWQSGEAGKGIELAANVLQMQPADLVEPFLRARSNLLDSDSLAYAQQTLLTAQQERNEAQLGHALVQTQDLEYKIKILELFLNAAYVDIKILRAGWIVMWLLLVYMIIKS